MTTDAELLQAVTRAIRGGSSSSAGHVLAAERAIAAVRASGRLAPEVDGDVVQMCIAAFEPSSLGGIKVRVGDNMCIGLSDDVVGKLLSAWGPIIAAAAEAKAREECAKIAEEHAANNAYSALPGETDGNLIGRRVAASIAGLIRTGSAS